MPRLAWDESLSSEKTLTREDVDQCPDEPNSRVGRYHETSPNFILRLVPKFHREDKDQPADNVGSGKCS